MALTSSQEKFLNVRNKNILLSASAGSGKTFILIQKICDSIINKNEDITNFLVLTFTNAAANELKKRLEISLKQNLNEHCLEQLEKLPSASISTFDSFCSNLLKKYFFKININPNFNVLLEDEAEVLKTRSFNYSLESLYKNSIEDYFFIFKNFKLDTSLNSLYIVICKLYNSFYGEIVDINEIVINKEKYYNFFNEYICDKYKQLTNLVNELTINLKQNEMLKEVSIINEISSFINSIKENNGLFKNLEFINNLKLSTMPKINKDYNFVQEELYNKLKLLKSNYISKLNTNIKKINFNEEDFDNCYNLNLKILKIVCQIYNNFIVEYNKLKEEKNVYDFINIEKLTLNLLSQNNDVCEFLKESYKYIFIDEYQDTSVLQDDIISLIQKNDNLTVVGDIKQSIYRFRKASPKLFIDKLKFYPNNQNDTVISLNENFRSNPNILKFCNSVFKYLITNYSSQIDYQDSMFVPALTFEKNDIPSVEIVTYNSKENEKPNLKQIYDVNKDIQKPEISDGVIEADIVADRIYKILSTKIFDPKVNNFRNPSFKDFSILIQKRGNFYNDFLRRLDELNIPYKSNITINLLDNKECLILVDFINILDNLNNDICLISVLYSCIGNFKNFEIIEIAKNEEYTYFYEKFINYNKNNELYMKINKFLNFINETKKQISLYGMYEVLSKIIEKYNYIYYYTLKLNSVNVQNNIENFLKMFKNFDDYSISSALDILNNNNKKCNVESKNIDAINISTIHYSKGLEYPIVFLVNSNSNIVMPDKESVIISDKLGVAFINEEENNLIKKLVNLYEKKEDFSERIRLLYVALTRAKNHLIIVGKKEEEKDIIDIFEAKNFYSLINYALNFEKEKNNNLYTYSHYNNLEVDKSEVKINNEFDLTEIEKIYKIIEKRKDNNVSFKNTVTKLSNDGEYYNPTPTKLYLNELKTSNQDVGIKYHEILEKVDFEKETTEILDNLKILTKEEYNLIKNIIIKIKELLTFKVDEIYKEKTFVSEFNYNELVFSNIKDKVMLQGKIDLLVLGEKNILIDYKYSNKNKNMLTKTYVNQLQMYKKAVESAFSIKLDFVYLINLKTGEFISI